MSVVDAHPIELVSCGVEADLPQLAADREVGAPASQDGARDLEAIAKATATALLLLRF